MKRSLPRILLAGTNSGCGKTTVVCALLQAMQQKTIPVHAFKCGPDYIDPMFHSSILGTPCRNLDLQFLQPDMLRYLMAKSCPEGTLALIEGVMGYYDGAGISSQFSSRHVGQTVEAPAVLTVNARGAARSLLAAIEGFVNLEPDSGIRGVIFNQCSAMFYPMLKQAVLEHFGGRIQPLGYLPPMPECTLESRHLGLITAEEIADLHEKLEKLGKQAQKSIDFDALLALAAAAPELEIEAPRLPVPGAPVRIAVAKDKAFCFYYADGLDLLTQLGAELVPFSPLQDAALPENIQGLYLGGGYPELYAEALSQNTAMRLSIREALRRELPCIAECGGFLYLQSELEGFPMVGHFPGKAFNTGKLSRFGYVTLEAKKDNLLCRAGDTLQAHEFHYYDVPEPGTDFTARKSTGRHWECAYADEHLYAGFPHFHFASNPQMADAFLRACRKELTHD